MIKGVFMEKTQRTKDMERLWDALKLCHKLHEDQVDKCGQPYWIHPFTVAMRGFTGYDGGKSISYAIVGLLHDVPEDTGMSIEALATLIELTNEEVEALKLLTRPNGMPYDEYINSIAESNNEIAIVVKLDDLLHNGNLNRFTEASIDILEKDKKRADKYTAAFYKLHNKLNEM
jgi:(p)ppGpp synthase/HD superfamily hydrolase